MAARRKTSRTGRRPGAHVPPAPGSGPRAVRTPEWVHDRIIEHATYLERLKAGASRDARRALARAADEMEAVASALMDRLKGRGLTSGAWETKTSAIAIAKVSAIARGIASTFVTSTRGLMLDVARFEAEFIGRVTFAGLPVEVSFRSAPVEQLRAVTKAPMDGRQLADWAKGIETQTKAKVVQEIQRGLARGEATPAVARRVRDVMQTTARNAETVTRTAINHASAGAREVFAEQNRDVVVGVRWVSTLDARTTQQCAALDGKVFRIGEGPRPPLHPNCRSTVVMLTRSPEEILSGKDKPITDDYLRNAGARSTAGATRPGTDTGKQVIREYRASTAYGSWLKQQPAATQDRVLGRTRGRMFRSGKVQIDQFIGSDYRPLTLDQIGERWGIDVARFRR